MGRMIGLALGLCVCIATNVPAADNPASTTAEKLIEQLGSPDFKIREAAGRALAARGDEVLPALRKAVNHPDAEVRQRLANLITDIEHNTLLAPRRITMKVTNTPLREAIAELSKQSGYKIELQGAGNQVLVSLNVVNVPFWEAFDKLCVQGGLILQQHYDAAQGLVLISQDSIVPFVDYRGVFRLSAGNFHYNRSLNFATLPRKQIGLGQRTEQLSFGFSVVGEPKLPLLSVGQPRLTLVVDDQDQSLVPSPVGRGYETYYGGYYGNRNLVWNTQVQLAGPSPGARQVKILRGMVPVTLLAEQKPEIVIDNIATVKNKKFEGKEVSLDIEELKEGPGKTIQLMLTARRASKDNQYDYTWTNSLQQRIELRDDKGNKFQSNGFNWNTGTPTSVQGTFMFSDPTGKIGKPAKLTYYGWVTVQHQIEFEFRDLPLP